MNKIELTKSQIEAYASGATVFMFPIHKDVLFFGVAAWFSKNKVSPFDSYWYKEALKSFSPVKIGDKDIFVQEDFMICEPENYHEYKIQGTYISYDTKSTNHFGMEWFSASEMTKEQSRYSFEECLDVKIVKVQEIEFCETQKISPLFPYRNEFKDFYNNQLKELNIDRTYEDNDYIFLIEFKR